MIKKSKEKANKGITLIALVVTIVVLIILAGITIASLTGEKGIIKEARTAKELSEKAALEEQVELAIIKAEQKYKNPTIDNVIEEIKNNKVISNSDQVDKKTGDILSDLGYLITGKLDDYIGKTSTGDNEGGDIPTPPTPSKPTTVEEAITAGTVLDENNPTTIKDKYDNEIKVPEGFKIASDSAEDVTGGVVIEDTSNSATAGSQFVWIPVGEVKYEGGSKTIELKRHLFASDGTVSDYPESGCKEEDSRDIANLLNRGNTIAKDIEAFKTTVTTNHGYYIGRYEAKVAGETKRTAKTNDSGLGQITVKENDYVYNYVTEPQAATLSRGMYTGKKFTSDLVNSYAWDTAIVFIQEFSGDGDYSRQTRIQTTLAEKGKATNGTNYDVRCNIYDMAGNCVEWTTETQNSDNPCIYRGGICNDTSRYTCYRYMSTTSTGTVYTSFRPVLY